MFKRNNSVSHSAHLQDSNGSHVFLVVLGILDLYTVASNAFCALLLA